MIDTIILSIPKDKIISIDMTANGVDPWDLHSKYQGYEKYIRNASNKDKESGLYFPRLTGIKRNFGKQGKLDQSVKIEFSAPKLLYLNNLDELEEKDFGQIISALENRLRRMGVIVSEQTLKEASVSAVHYSKNVILANGYTCQYVLSELGKINLNKRFDLTRARYMNDGQSIALYTISHSLVFYDKIADIAKPEKRAIDKEQNPFQYSLFSQLNKKAEILRLEIRLSKKQKLNSLFEKLGYQKNPTFEDVFRIDKSLAVIKHYWSTMIKDSAVSLFAFSPTTKDLLKQILLADKTLKLKQVLYFVGLIQVAKEGNGMRETRAILAKYSDDRSWYRAVKDYREINSKLANIKPRDWLDQVERQLADYIPYRLSTSQDLPCK